jgi:hypothetical protein
MSWLLFLDESGHDHKAMPYEACGGTAIHAGQSWPFVQAVQRLESGCFGAPLGLYKKELRGSTPLDKKRYPIRTRRGRRKKKEATPSEPPK